MFDNLSDKLQSVFSGLRSKGRLNEEDIDAAMREIRMALLEADVNFKVVKSFIKRTKERCLTAEIMDSLTPAQNVIKVVLDELTELLGREEAPLKLSSRIPNVIMLVGLQGSGKTTAAAKLAYLLKGKNHNPLLVACDVYRPAAADQLQTLGDEMGIRVYRGEGKDPVKIAKEGVRDAIDSLRDVVIVDTAGRLHVDDEMMEEAQAIKAAVEPDQIYMVVDAMTGGYDVKLSEVHGMAQRGGSVVTFVRYGESVAEPIVEEGQADILIAFERLEALRYAHFLKKGGAIIVNDTRIDPMPVVIGAAEYPEHILEELSKKYNVLAVDATAEALKLGNARVFNTIILGVAAQHMHFSKEEWLQVIADTVPPKTIDINQKAFLTGYAYNGNHTEQGQE